MCDKRKMSNWTVTERDLAIFKRWTNMSLHSEYMR